MRIAGSASSRVVLFGFQSDLADFSRARRGTYPPMKRTFLTALSAVLAKPALVRALRAIARRHGAVTRPSGCCSIRVARAAPLFTSPPMRPVFRKARLMFSSGSVISPPRRRAKSARRLIDPTRSEGRVRERSSRGSSIAGSSSSNDSRSAPIASACRFRIRPTARAIDAGVRGRHVEIYTQPF